MSSNTPTVRQIAWISLIPQMAFMGALIAIYFLLKSSDPLLHAALTYLLLSFGLRTVVPKDHRQGMKLVRQSRFAEAIPHFEKSYAFFSKNLWIDKFRFLTLLSSSGISYREMALINTAYCYSQIGDGSKAESCYNRTLKEFPDSMMAQAALRMINSSKGLKASDD